MKTRPHRLRRFILVWALIYIIALLFGTFLACMYSYRTNANVLSIAEKDAAYYSKNETFPLENAIFQSSAYVYTTEGTLLDSQPAYGNNMDFDGTAAALLPKVNESGTLYRMIHDREMDAWIGIMVAVPFQTDGGGSAVYFWVKGLQSLQSILAILFFSLSILWIVSCLYSVLMLRNVRATEKLRHEYIANVSHDLKSPIASIRALAESMYDEVIVDEEKRKKCLGLILSESSRLERTVLDMMELAKLQSGQKSFSTALFSAEKVFSESMEKYSVLCDELGIVFHPLENMHALPALMTNADRVSELLGLLLENAGKFVGRDGHVWVEAAVSAKNLTVCVRDNGIGIGKDDQRRIFERFYKCDLSHNSKGSGLGLAIAAELAAGLNEKLWVESEPGSGSAFYFTVHIA